ncbi:MAG: hypothetical protein IPM64_14085 [Phycisphaerales bacterium]|nr:hypothetical protein [Phycisphaerales bacterium]
MTVIRPIPPYVWPEPRAFITDCRYKECPPFGDLVRNAQSLFGTVCAIDSDGVKLLEEWLEHDPSRCARLIAVVYPTCGTTQAALDSLVWLVDKLSINQQERRAASFQAVLFDETSESWPWSDHQNNRIADRLESTVQRLDVHVCALPHLSDRTMNTLCLISRDAGNVHVVAGSGENFGLCSRRECDLNFVCRADAAAVEAFKRQFDWLWGRTSRITAEGAASIPELVVPPGSDEAAERWRRYEESCKPTDPSDGVFVRVDRDSGGVELVDEAGTEIKSPTEELGLEKMCQTAERVARLYERGRLVTIDKQTRVPPLDAPVDPRLFGDDPGLSRGAVSRRVSMRVSILDDKMLKEINKHRTGVQTMLTRFTFALADGMRWIPCKAQALLEQELERISKNGTELIASYLKGGVEEFIKRKREALAHDINMMYQELRGSGQAPSHVIDRVTASIGDRLKRAQSGDLLPRLSYSLISFDRTENSRASPWGQACSMLSEIAAFPRRLKSDAFFLRGIMIDEEELLQSMNVAGDAILQRLEDRRIKERCKMELAFLDQAKAAAIDGKARCEIIWRLIDGEPVEALQDTLADLVKSPT